MSLIPWRNKREGQGGSCRLWCRCEAKWIGCSILSCASRSARWIGRTGATASGRRPSTSPRDDKEVSVRAELPGIDPKDLDVTVVGNQLILSGEKRESSETQGERVYHSETRYGSFRRTVPLPEGVDTEHVDAQYANGVLTLRLPKTAPANQKRIEVKVK